MTRFSGLICLLLGAIAACGFAPLELWPLTLGAFALWMWLVHAAPTLKLGLWRGWLFGVGHFTIANNWIQHAFDFQDKMPPALGYGAVVALALYLAVFPALAAGLAWRLTRRAGRIDAPYILAFGATWIATEWLRAGLFTGYAWDPLAVMWVPVQPVAWLSTLIGTYALSGMTVAAAGSLLLLRPSYRTAVYGAVTAAFLLNGKHSYIDTDSGRASPATPRLVIVQPGISQDARGEEDSEVMIRALVAHSGKPGPAPRLIVWPEGVIRDYVEDGYPWRYIYWQEPPDFLRRRLARVLGPNDILLFGGNALQFDKKGELATATNSIYALDAEARLRGRYDKAHLVPYGEYLPMRWLLEPLGLSRLVPGDIDFRDGRGPHGLALAPFGEIAMQICYEIIFSGEVVGSPRPRLLFNPSNDAWFGTWGPPQHLAQARLRAIEEGIAIVRSTPTGISAAIGPDGRILAQVPPGPAGSIELPLPQSGPPTLFSRIGNWAALLIGTLLAASAVALRRRQR